jgi:hypothetical protein
MSSHNAILAAKRGSIIAGRGENQLTHFDRARHVDGAVSVLRRETASPAQMSVLESTRIIEELITNRISIPSP